MILKVWLKVFLMGDQKVSQMGSQKLSQMEMPLVITTLLCLVDQKVLPMGML